MGVGFAVGAQVSALEKMEKACLDWARMNIVASEVPDLTVPADEGQVSMFAPANWQVESALLSQMWALERALLAELGTKSLTAPIAGSLVITERSVLFVPSVGTTGVRIPFATIWNTDARYNLMGEPRAIVIETCARRLDVFTLGQKDDSQRPDPHAIAHALDLIETRMQADPVRKELREKVH